MLQNETSPAIVSSSAPLVAHAHSRVLPSLSQVPDIVADVHRQWQSWVHVHSSPVGIFYVCPTPNLRVLPYRVDLRIATILCSYGGFTFAFNDYTALNITSKLDRFVVYIRNTQAQHPR